MPNISIELGTEVNKIEEQIIKIRIPHTKYFIIGEKTERSKWDVFILEPDTKVKEIIKKGISTKTFALTCNVAFNTPFPYAGKEQTIETIKQFIKTIIKK